MSEGFSGLRVISFESRRAFEMDSLVRRHGGDSFVAPSMREIPFEVNQEALEFARKVVEGKADAVIFMTGVGTSFLFQVIEKHYSGGEFFKSLSQKILIARGPKPVVALKSAGLTPAFTAESPNTWREVLSVLDKECPVQGRKIFVQEYGIENREFLKELKNRGAHVSRVPVYRWSLPEDLTALRSALAEVSDGKADVLLFTNATQIYHLLRVASEEGLESSFREALGRVVVASLGPIVTENLKECGLPVDFQSENSKMGLFVQEAAQKCPGILSAKRATWEKTFSPLTVKEVEIRPFSGKSCEDSAFMKACRMEDASFTPVWLMRQAGRYMKEYRQIRSRVSFLDLCKNPDLVCEVTVTAQERLGADAAIIFSDILLILEPMRVGLEYTKGEGPYIHTPVRAPEQVENIQPAHPLETMDFVMTAIKKTRSVLKKDIPLIGFAGAPFTVVSYLVEGKGSDNYYHTKTLMYSQPRSWNELMSKVTDSTVEYVNAQIDSGVQAVQIFDSWIGCLSPQDYKEYVLPHMKRLFSSLRKDTPLIHFGTGTAGLLDLMREGGGTVVGLDWRVSLGSSWKRLGKVAVQGNLDPLTLCSDLNTLREKTKKILDEARDENGRRKPGHIFNLGHGVLPQTPVENAKALIEMVHEFSSK